MDFINKYDEKILKGIKYGFGIFGLIMIICSILLYVIPSNKCKKYIKAEAIVLNTFSDSTSVVYFVNNQPIYKTYNFQSSFVNPNDIINIYYNPSNPSNSIYLNSFLTACYILFPMGLIFIAFPIIYSLVTNKKLRNKKAIIINGKKLNAVITGYEVINSINISYDHPCKIKCTYTDEFLDRKYNFISDMIWVKSDKLQELTKCHISVYVDRNDSNNYYVDKYSITKDIFSSEIINDSDKNNILY